MRHALIAIGLVLTVVGAADAQGRGRGNKGGRDNDDRRGIPAGHLPPPGECRVWHEGRPPGHQPPPTNCREAERIAAGSRNTRVIYGDDRNDRRNDRDDRWDDRGGDRDRDDRRAEPRYPYPENRYPNGRYPESRRSTDGVPFDNGYRDGYDAGREDATVNRRHDPTRNSDYRAASRGYDPRYGSRDEYRDRYREGFRAGYSEGYDDSGTRQRGGWRLPWPF